jgi:hypothetical protein
LTVSAAKKISVASSTIVAPDDACNSYEA